MKPNFSEETKQEIIDRQNWKCWVKDCKDRIYEIHHILSNSKPSRRPLEPIRNGMGAVPLPAASKEECSLLQLDCFPT